MWLIRVQSTRSPSPGHRVRQLRTYRPWSSAASSRASTRAPRLRTSSSSRNRLSLRAHTGRIQVWVRPVFTSLIWSPSPVRNARARAFLMRYTRCNVCDVEGTDVYVRSCTGVEELGTCPGGLASEHAYVWQNGAVPVAAGFLPLMAIGQLISPGL